MSIHGWMDKENLVYIQNRLFSHKKEGNPVTWKHMDEPGGHYATWNKSDRERQIMYILTYMWNLKNPNS